MYVVVIDKSSRKNGEKTSVDNLEIKVCSRLVFVLEIAKENVDLGYGVYVLKMKGLEN